MRKNRTKKEWRQINRVVEERSRQGKDSTVFIEGVELPKEKLCREIARTQNRQYEGMCVAIASSFNPLTMIRHWYWPP
jgi:hypothetical protein